MSGLMIKLSLSIFFIFSFTVYSQDSKIYWINQGGSKISSAHLDGSHMSDVITGLNMAEGIAIDCTSTPKQIYFSERGESRIMRVNFDGSNLDSVVTGAAGVKDIELDLKNRKIYWAIDTYSDDRIQCADMDSLNSNIVDLFTNSSAMHRISGIAVDTIANWVFWTQSRYGLVDVVKRMTFGGTGDTILGNYLNPKDIDVLGGRIYWLWYGYDMLVSANKNGSGLDTILTNINALYFHIDTVAGKIFLSNGSKISSCNLDGSNLTDIVTGIYSPASIAAYVNPLTVSVDNKNEIARKFELKQNYPNPFNSITNFSFTIPNTEYVKLEIYNVLGQKIETLVSKTLAAGNHTYKWNASEYAGGIYYYRLETDLNAKPKFSQTKKLILLK